MGSGEVPPASLTELLRRFEAEHAALTGSGHAQRFFCGVYLRSTRAMREELERGGFTDPAWVDLWTRTFAALYLRALQQWRAGAAVPEPWRLALTASDGLSPLVHVLIGLNAHLNFDLPQSLLAVCDDTELADPVALRTRHADFRHVDTVMLRRIPQEDAELRAIGGPRGSELAARLLYPLNLVASRRFLVSARRSVWHNAQQLSAARTAGANVLSSRLAELERLSAGKVEDLQRPGPVLLRLAVTGFGVRLPGATAGRGGRTRPLPRRARARSRRRARARRGGC